MDSIIIIIIIIINIIIMSTVWTFHLPYKPSTP